MASLNPEREALLRLSRYVGIEDPFGKDPNVAHLTFNDLLVSFTLRPWRIVAMAYLDPLPEETEPRLKVLETLLTQNFALPTSDIVRLSPKIALSDHQGLPALLLEIPASFSDNELLESLAYLLECTERTLEHVRELQKTTGVLHTELTPENDDLLGNQDNFV